MINLDELCVNGVRIGVRMDSSNPAFENFISAIDERAIAHGQEPPSSWSYVNESFIIYGYSTPNWFQRGSVSFAPHIDVKIIEPDQVDIGESLEQLDVERLLSMLLI